MEIYKQGDCLHVNCKAANSLRILFEITLGQSLGIIEEFGEVTKGLQ